MRRYVELGYATTMHLAQGSTADTCHVVLTGDETRETLYVAMTRGGYANHLYLDVGAPADRHAATTPEVINPSTSVEILERILAREGAKRSATTQRRLDEDPSLGCATAATRYRRRRVGAARARQGRAAAVAARAAGARRPDLGRYLSRRFAQVLDAPTRSPAAAGHPMGDGAASQGRGSRPAARRLAGRKRCRPLGVPSLRTAGT